MCLTTRVLCKPAVVKLHEWHKNVITPDKQATQRCVESIHPLSLPACLVSHHWLM